MKVFVFESTRAVIKSEKAVRAENIECLIIPVPRSVSANCGMALKIKEKYEEKVREVLKALKINTKVFNIEDITL